MVNRTRRPDVHLVTQAKRPMSEDIAYRERRYLVMMGIRVGCFVMTIILFVSHAGWLAAIPAVGAIAIPYFAVVFANGGREPTSTRGFRPYEPNLPAPRFGSSDSPLGSSDSPFGSSEPPLGFSEPPQPEPPSSTSSEIPAQDAQAHSQWHTGSHHDSGLH
jgi:hypothetical protein